MSRSRVKLDLGPHGKVLASVLDYDDAKTVAAGRFNVDTSSVQLYVSDGEDLWELHPSAFQDVVAENGVIVAKALALPSSPTRRPAASTSAFVTNVTKIDSPRAETSTPLTPTSLTTRPLELASSSSRSIHTPTSRISRPRASSVDSTTSTSSTSSDSSSSSSSGSSSSSSSGSSSRSSSSAEGRRSESVQDVTATSATVRTIIGPNGLPVSSKERWDPKTHRLMFEKLNEIISSETIYYTRKYTEERYRIFQLLIDNYGDTGVKGNFLRGRTAQALISRVSGVLRTARERGEKIKQPFKFFFPNRKDEEGAGRSATAPAPSATVAAASSRATAASTNGAGAVARSQTLPAQARGQQNGQGQGRSKAKGKGRAAPPAGAAATSTAASTSGRSSTASAASTQIGPQGSVNGNGRGKGKGKQGNPPEIRRRNATAPAGPTASPSSSRLGKRTANGAPTANTPAQKKPRSPNKQPNTTPARGRRRSASPDEPRASQSGREQSRSRAPSSHRRERSASPRPRSSGSSHQQPFRRDRDSDDHGHGEVRYSQRSERLRERSPLLGGDSWSRSRDEPLDRAPTHGWDANEDRGHTSTSGWDVDEGRGTPRRGPPRDSLPRRPSWVNGADQHDANDNRLPPSSQRFAGRGRRSPSRSQTALFRAETRSPPPLSRPSPGPRGNAWRGRDTSSRPSAPSTRGGSPGRRKTAVEHALENLAAAGADTSRPSPSNGGGRDNGWGSANRSWRRNSQGPQRQGEGSGQGRGNGDAGWPSPIQNADRFTPASPRTPPRSE